MAKRSYTSSKATFCFCILLYMEKTDLVLAFISNLNPLAFSFSWMGFTNSAVNRERSLSVSLRRWTTSA